MTCLFEHNWGWPRRRGGKDVQVCLSCGTERESKVSFGGPRYRRTQDAVPGFAISPLHIEADVRGEQGGEFASLAA
jgi:hypothetical protein